MTISEAVAKTVAKGLSDSQSMADSRADASGKGATMQESFALVDALSKATGRGISDIMNLTDQQIKGVVKVVTDTLSISDDISLPNEVIRIIKGKLRPYSVRSDTFNKKIY